MIASVEKHHEERYKKLADNVTNGLVFKKSEKVVWKCSNCGYIHEGAEAQTNVLHVHIHDHIYEVECTTLLNKRGL